MRGLVLAGGQSVRMRADKAALLIDGAPLLARSVALLEPLTRSVHVAIGPGQASDPLRQQFPVLIDVPGVQGPAAGLLAAWRHDAGAAWLVLACDMPGVSAPVLEALAVARDAGRGGTAWRQPGDGLPEPLCAIWEPATLARLAALVAQGGSRPVSPRALLAAADPLLLDPPRPAVLNSVNTPAELHRYLEQTHGHEP
jgi:molybdopterin-guanine dinucleotide biosynthesis protein A